MYKQLHIGLFGFGCVGQGLYDIINKTAFEAEIVKICVKDKQKNRSLPAHHFTFDKDEILQNPQINLVVELIDDADEAYRIVSTALKNGKNVVTANKKMLAEHLSELIDLQRKYGTSLLYEAACCGSIPIIRNLAEYYDNEWLNSVSGIFNGSSNYILTKVFQENQPYAEALAQAQQLGFAETNPILDVGAFDPKYKLCIITAQAYGIVVSPEAVFNYGIQTLSTADLQFAREKGFKIKLIAQAYKINEEEITLFVMPQLIPKEHYLYHVENEYNGVIVEAAFSDKQVFLGKGAGGHPTGSAVLSDISACRYEYRYEYKKASSGRHIRYSTNQWIEIYLRYTHEADLQLFDFETISVKYQGTDTNYLIGVVSLTNLLEKRDILAQKDIFLANTGRKIASQPATVPQAQETVWA